RMSCSSFFEKSETICFRLSTRPRPRLTPRPILSTIGPYLSQKHIDFRDDYSRPRDMVRKVFQILLLKLLALDVAPVGPGLLPFQRQVLNCLNQIVFDSTGAHER